MGVASESVQSTFSSSRPANQRGPRGVVCPPLPSPLRFHFRTGVRWVFRGGGVNREEGWVGERDRPRMT